MINDLKNYAGFVRYSDAFVRFEFFVQIVSESVIHIESSIFALCIFYSIHIFYILFILLDAKGMRKNLNYFPSCLNELHVQYVLMLFFKRMVLIQNTNFLSMVFRRRKMTKTQYNNIKNMSLREV